MEILKAVVLGLLQGVTEFVPVSSSAHLVLVPWLLGWEPPGLLFDTLVHWGTLLAVVGYFWRDWLQMIFAWLHGLVHWDWSDPNARLMWLLVLGSLPAALLGYLLEDSFESLFGEPVWVGAFLLVTAVLLLLSEWLGRRKRTTEDMNWIDALLIGLAQAAAIAPGISRSGATMAVGLLRGMKRREAARFSFLLSTPVILGAGVFQVVNAMGESGARPDWVPLLVGLLVAAVSGYLAIRFLLKYLQMGRLYVFAMYCTWVGVSCLIVAFLR